ncbi:hypothetical protein AXA44_29685 [Rhodococcus sp. SC4]|nr:hypothetical protein AXA44_29685 [Rhodococcus sp. SC4]
MMQPETIADVVGGIVVDAHIEFTVNGQPIPPLHLTVWWENGPRTYSELRYQLVDMIAANLAFHHNPLRLAYLAEEARQ